LNQALAAKQHKKSQALQYLIRAEEIINAMQGFATI